MDAVSGAAQQGIAQPVLVTISTGVPADARYLLGVT